MCIRDRSFLLDSLGVSTTFSVSFVGAAHLVVVTAADRPDGTKAVDVDRTVKRTRSDVEDGCIIVEVAV